MANTRYKGANSSERLTLSTLSDNDMFQTRHLPGTVNDADKGVSKALLQALPIAVCATAAATAAKVGTLAPESCPDFSLVNGRTVHVYFSAANTASVPTLNLAGTGALPITYPDGSYVGKWPAGCCLDLMYISIVDGNTAIERWVVVSSLPVDEVTLNNMQSVTSNAVARRCLVQNKEFTLDASFAEVPTFPIRVRQIGNIVYTSGLLIINTPISASNPIITINNLHIAYNLICQITYWNNSSQQYAASVVSVRQNGDNLTVATENVFSANDYIYFDISFLIDN